MSDCQAHRLLEEARNENRMLEERCNTLKEQVNIFGQEAEQLREEQRIREANHEEEVQLLKNQGRNSIGIEKRPKKGTESQFPKNICMNFLNWVELQ